MPEKNKKREVLKNVLDKVKGANPIAYAKELGAQWKSQYKANKGADKLAKALMGKDPKDTDKWAKARFPEPQLIGDMKWEKRKKEIKNLIKQGKIQEAKDFIKEKREEFNKLNY
jgi:hypothetical protein